MKDDKFSGDLQAWIEPELEARLVALLLGEASDFEREELERLMGERPELAVFKRRLEAIDGLVRESVKPEMSGDADWKLGAEKRAAVLKVLGTPAVKAAEAAGESPQPPIPLPDRKRNWGRRIRAVAACLVLIIVLGVLTSPFFFGSLKRSANMALARDDARLEMEGLDESYPEVAGGGASMDSKDAGIADYRNLREPTHMTARQSPSAPLERGMVVEGREAAEESSRSENLDRSKSNALAQLRANLDHGGLSGPEGAPREAQMTNEDIVFSDADAPDADPFAAPASGEQRLRVDDDRDGRGREREALATRGVTDTSGALGRDFFFAEEGEEERFAGEGGRTRNAGDIINPDDFKRVHKAPVEANQPVGGVVTGGLRSGDAAITRNSIDAILSKPGSVSRKSGAGPGASGGPVPEVTIVDAVPELTDGALGLRSGIETKFSEVSQANDKELGFDWFVDESATKVTNGKDAPADVPFETEAKAEDGLAMGDVPQLGALFETGNARPAAATRPVAKRQPPGNVGTSEANKAGYEAMKSATEEVRYKLEDTHAEAENSPVPGSAPAPEPTPPTLALSDGESFGDGWKFSGGGGGGGFDGNAPDDATVDVEWQKKVPRVKVPTSTYMGYSGGDAAARSRNSVDSIPADPFGAPEQAKAEPVGEKNQEGDELRRDLYMSEGYFDLGKFDEAQRHAEAVLDKDPSNEDARRLMERATAAQSNDYRSADHDDSRARLLKEVDRAWEVDPPEEGERDEKVVEVNGLLPTLERQLGEVEGRLDDMRQTVSSRRNEAVDQALESHDYIEAKQEYEDSKETLQKMKLQHVSNRISLRIPRTPITIEEKGAVKKNKRLFGKDTYEAKTTLQVHPEATEINPFRGGQETALGATLAKGDIPTEVELAKSTGVLKKVVKDLDLGNRWGLSEKKALEKLKDVVEVESVKNANLLNIEVELPSSEDAKLVSERIAQTYADQRKEREMERAQKALSALDAELRDQEDIVEEKRKVLDTIVQAVGIPYVEGSRFGTIGESENSIHLTSERQLYELEREKQQLEVQIKTLLKLESEEMMKYAAGLNLPDNGVPALYEQYQAALREREAKLSTGLGESHPEIKARDASIQKLREDMEKAITSTRTILQTQHELTEGRLKEMKAVTRPEPNPIRRRVVPEDSASEKPFSTFSLHVSDVSFKLAQAALQKGQWPEAARVRTEEFVNAFDYQDPTPAMAEKVGCQIGQAVHPFAQQRNLMRISMRAAALGRGAGTPLRLTVLLDNSGSMDRSDRAESVRRAFALLAAQLNENDEVTLISFARTPRLLRDRVSGTELGDLSELVGQLQSEGGTNLEAALQLGIDKAKASFLAEAQNRIILLTDGAANLGNAEPDTLRGMIETLREQGIAFDACGVGADGLNDEILESLTRKGDGRYYFLDRPEDADAGFAKQIAGALRPAAQNVKVQVEFNPERVGRYKLYGFEKHELKKEDFRNDSVDAAELAAEEAGVAVYQVQTLPAGKGPVGTVSVRFRDMTSGQMVERSWEIPYEAQPARLDEAEASVRLAGTAALFAERLKGTPVGDVVDLGVLGKTARGLQSLYPNQERIGHIIEMIEQARRLSE